ncbi:MAG TPA: LuxR C-terminal-related transcriptional regulator [Solirubrobacteraceae bacterium]
MLEGAALGEDVGPQVEAGHAALAAGDWEAAREAFQRSLDAAPSAAAFEGLGLASRWLGAQDAAIRSLQQAYRLHRRADDRRAAARVALQLCLGEFYFHDDMAVGLGWIERADRLLEDVEPGAEHGWLALLRGHLALQVDRDPVRARAHAAKARDLGRESGVVDVEMMALALEGLTLVCEGEVEEGMRRLDEATAATVAGELADLDAISSCCCYLIDACKRVRDFERAAQWCEHVKGFCEQWSDRLTFAACRAHYADILIWRGEWTQAEAELRSSLGPLADIHPNRIADGMVRLAELRRRQGMLEEAARLLEAADGHFLAPLVRAALALDRGDAPAAAHEAQRALRRLPAEGLTDRAPALEILVRARLAAGEQQGAREAADALRAIASSAGTAASAAAAAMGEGLIASAAGSWDLARPAFEDAVDLYARAGGRWEAAHARRELARTLRALGHHEAAEREARAADEALRALGASPAAPDAPARPAGLTARELEVLRLVARGRSNLEIAGELVLSVRTVERHIANIYDKIGASGRAARAAAASYALAVGVA